MPALAGDRHIPPPSSRPLATLAFVSLAIAAHAERHVLNGEQETHHMAQPAAAAKANPGPLGLMGFGVTTLVAMLVNTNIFGNNLTADAVLPLALVFGGGAQLLAGMWEFYAGNTFGATAFTGFGAFWISYYFFVVSGFAGKAGSYGVATYLLGWAIFTLVIFFAALRVNFATTTLIGLLFLTFVVLSIANFVAGNGNDASTILKVDGWLGIVTALNAFYNATAGLLKEASGRTILPV
jgi:succinate-acetate transporter protein